MNCLQNAAVEAGVIGAEDIQGAIEDESFGDFDEAYGSYGESLANEGFDSAWNKGCSHNCHLTVTVILYCTRSHNTGHTAACTDQHPAYHWPTVGNVLRSMWERGWSFIKRAGTIILLSSIVIWAASAFGLS